MIFVRRLLYSALILSLLLSASCTGRTSVTNSWKKSDYAGKPFKSILVVALIDDPNKKMFWENTVADRLQKSGIDPVAISISAFPRDRGLTLKEIVQYVQDRHIDGVLVTRLVDVQREQVPEYPAGPLYGGYYTYYNNFGDYYPVAYKSVYEVDDPATRLTVLLETNLYRVENLELVWSMCSDTFEPRSINRLADSVSRTVIANLRKNGLL